jgi:hypothetical protein
MSSSTPFPLFSLPKELRLMIYERIPIKVRAHHGETQTHTCTIIDKRIDMQILASCRQVHEEAFAIVQKQIWDILDTPPRMIMDIKSAGFIHKAYGPLAHFIEYIIVEITQQGKLIGDGETM